MLIFAIISAGYLALGGLIAWGMNSAFDIGGPIDPGAGSSPSMPKPLLLAAVVLFWPLAIFVPIIAVIGWVNSGSH